MIRIEKVDFGALSLLMHLLTLTKSHLAVFMWFDEVQG